jgi:hypothetical protein
MAKTIGSRPKAGRWVFAGSVLLAVVATTALSVMALLLSPSEAAPLFEETGPFEQASPWLWLALALFIPLVFGKPTLEVAAGMIVAIAAAAREWDWHVAFTEYSVLKPPFYYRAEHSVFAEEGQRMVRVGLAEQVIAGAIVLVVLASVVVLVARLIHLRPWKRPLPWWVFALGFAFGMLVFTKAVDRAPAILEEDFDITMGVATRQACSAIEEGLEMLLPIFFAAHTLALARWHKATRRPERAEA